MLSRDDFTIKRSPARVCWWIMFRGQMIETANTRNEAAEKIEQLRKVG